MSDFELADGDWSLGHENHWALSCHERNSFWIDACILKNSGIEVTEQKSQLPETSNIYTHSKHTDKTIQH